MYIDLKFDINDNLNSNQQILDIERLKKYIKIDKKISPDDNIILK